MISSYELLFMEWLKDAKKKGFIKSWEHEPETFDVFDAVKNKFNNKTKTIITTIRYTPDFKIKLTQKFKDMFPEAMYNLTLIESKGYV